jgi:sialidase-1
VLPLSSLILLTLAGPAPSLDKTDLFEAGKAGYTLYRVPAIVATTRGSLLAYCEARKGDGSDWATIDLLMRRSTDGGKSWSAPRKIAHVAGPIRKNPAALRQKAAKPEDVTYNNPVAIVDRKGGAVHFLFCLEYMRCFYQRSDDDGQTFSAPVEITATLEQFRKDYHWEAMATGPAHGIQLEGGRLLVPVWLSRGTQGNAHHPSVLGTIYSDDAGKTWQRGAIVANETSPLVNPNETVAVQLADGQVMLNIRNESKEHRRAVAFSPNGATDWTTPTFAADLKEPICMASLVRYDRKRLLFVNPDNLDRSRGKAMPGQHRDRKNLTVRLSEDDGKTWPVARTIDPGMSGYSDIAVGPDGTIYCLYERGSTDAKNHFRTRSLTLARFNLEWLTKGSKR